MIIRAATVDDTPRLVEMGLRFLQSTPYGLLFPPNPEAIGNMVGIVLVHGVVFVAEVDGRLDGFIALAELPHLITGETYADEIAWWVEPEARARSLGPRLLARAEAWARTRNLSMLKMIAPAGTHLGRFYVRAGFEAVETAYHKRL